MKKKMIFLIALIISLSYSALQAQLKCITECDKDTLELMIPTNFGKQIQGASGKLIYCVKSQKYFTGLIIVKGLSPSKNYILELYSKPGGVGGDSLPEPYGEDRFWDFYPIKTNEKGHCSTKFKRKINIGDYDVKFFVKEMIGDWDVVLHNNYLFFTIIQ